MDKCKTYLYDYHVGFIMLNEEEILSDLKEELPDCKLHIVPKGTFKVTTTEFNQFFKNMEQEPSIPNLCKNAPNGSGTQGRRGSYDGYSFDSFWEYIFYRYHKDVMGDVVVRNESEWIPYYDENGKQRKFYFDFVVNAQYYEVKGWFRPSDIAKKQATEGQVTFISGDEIKPMANELDSKFPGWRNDYVDN